MKFDVEYKTIDRVAGPLIVVSSVRNAAYGEIVRINLANGESKLGQVLESADGYAVVQVFGPTSGINVETTSVSFLGETFMTHVSDDMLGRIFNGQGKPKDGGAEMLAGAYSRAQEARNLSAIIGAEALSEGDKLYLGFGNEFEKRFINQGEYEDRNIEKTLQIGWELLSGLPEEELTRIKKEYIDKYLPKRKGEK